MPEKPVVVRDEPTSRWVVAHPGVEIRPMVEGLGTAIVLFRIAPGTRFESHTHEFAELGVVISGGGHYLFGSESRTVRDGDSFLIPPGVPHGFEVPPGGPPVVLIDISVTTRPGADSPTSSELIQMTEVVVRPLGAPGLGTM